MTPRSERLLPDGQPRYVRCYDNGGKTMDRYFVCFTGNYRTNGPRSTEYERSPFQYVSMSANPFHPQGFGQHGEDRNQIDVIDGYAPAMGRKNHLGTRIPFSQLPPDCQKLVLADYKQLWNLT